jgi:hypothetical protein
MNSIVLNPYHLLLTKVLAKTDIVDSEREFEVLPSSDTLGVTVRLPIIGSLWSDYTDSNRRLLLDLCRELVASFRENIGKDLNVLIELVDETDYVFVFSYDSIKGEEEPVIEELETKTLYFQGVLAMDERSLRELLKAQNAYRELGCNILDLSDFSDTRKADEFLRIVEASYKRIEASDEVIVNNDGDLVSMQEILFAVLLKKPVVLLGDAKPRLRSRFFQSLLKEYGVNLKP